MASCTRNKGITTYTLKLSEAEAVVLLDMVRRIAGPITGCRGQADSISAALKNGGVPIISQPTLSGRDSIEYTSTTTILL